MNALSISRLIFDTVPQLYEAEEGPFTVKLRVSGEPEAKIFSILPLSEDLERYLARSSEIWEELRPITEGEITQAIEREWIQQKFVVAWLELKTGVKDWGFILDYFRRLERRTTENFHPSKTILIEPGKKDPSAISLADSAYFKVFDWLGSSLSTYYRVDERLAIHALEAVSYTAIQDLSGYRFYPDRLHPILSAVQDPNGVVVHSSGRTLWIAHKQRIIAAKRIGESWTIYDKEHLIESVATVVDRQLSQNVASESPYCVACSLFQIFFDISMKHHGGLIIIDRPDNLKKYVVKGIEREVGSAMNRIFTHSPFNGLEFSAPEVRKLVELSSIDGALILDLRGNLLQVGSMILAHPDSVSRFGTRDAAAHSAAQFGATSFKISADGQVTMYFCPEPGRSDRVSRFDLL